MREVVGIVQDSRVRLQDDAAPPVYVSYQQHLSDYVGLAAASPDDHKEFVVRTVAAPASSLAAAIRAVVAEFDPVMAVDAVVPMRARLSQSAANESFLVRLLGTFAALALFLASQGIYGLISYSIAQRAREFGIRAALGACRGDIVRLVLWEGLTVPLAGVH